MSSEPLLPNDKAGSNGGHIVRHHSSALNLHKLVDLVLARAPATGARVTESLDYEPIQNQLYFQRVRQRKAVRKLHGYSGATLVRNIVVIATGVGTGLVSVAIGRGVERLQDWRNDTIQDMLSDNPGNLFPPFCFNVLYGMTLTAIGALMVTLWAPPAAGAGVTMVMAYLNGNHIPHLLEVKTLITKAVGATAGVASGLAIGPEGPMVHIGACIASNAVYANIAALRFLWPWAACRRRRGGSAEEPEDDTSTLEHTSLVCAAWEELHSDSEHREFISAGAAAGLSAAFGAPIGGVLFSMEEACSFWSKTVAWRCFIAAALAALTKKQLSARGEVGVIVFTTVRALSNEEWLAQLPLMVAVACAGGFLGAAFNSLRVVLWRFRASRSRKTLRIAEALAINAASVAVAFFMPALLPSCEPVPSRWAEDGYEGFQWGCASGEHNPLATIFLGGTDEVLGRMFSVGPSTPGAAAAAAGGFTIPSLLTYCALYLFLMALGAGVCVPAGVFMPSVSLGASFGLAAGLVFQQQFPAWGIQPGLYALICATATLAGVFRSAISLVVLVVEGTRSMNFLFGIIIAVVVSNFASSFFEHEGIYESEIERDHKNLTFLPHEAPSGLEAVTAADIMVPRPLTFPPVVQLATVLRVLRRTAHHGFPVVAPATDRLLGLVLRSQLLVLCRERAFCDESGRPLRAALAEQGVQRRIEHAMRFFYRSKTYANQRSADAADPVAAVLESALTHSGSLGDLHASASGSALRVSAAEGGFLASGSGFGLSPPDREAVTAPAANPSAANAAAGAAAAAAASRIDEPRLAAELGALAEALKAAGSPDRIFLDLRPFMNPAPLTVRAEMSGARVHRSFVTLGMRHLCVIDTGNRVVGIITRKDLDRAATAMHHGHADGDEDGTEAAVASVPTDSEGAPVAIHGFALSEDPFMYGSLALEAQASSSGGATVPGGSLGAADAAQNG